MLCVFLVQTLRAKWGKLFNVSWMTGKQQDIEVDDEEDEEKGKVKEKERDVLHLMI